MFFSKENDSGTLRLGIQSFTCVIVLVKEVLVVLYSVLIRMPRHSLQEIDLSVCKSRVDAGHGINET